MSGVSLSLVNLPLSISLGVAAATTPTRGVLGTVWSGLIAAAIGGSQVRPDVWRRGGAGTVLPRL